MIFTLNLKKIIYTDANHIHRLWLYSEMLIIKKVVYTDKSFSPNMPPVISLSDFPPMERGKKVQ